MTKRKRPIPARTGPKTMKRRRPLYYPNIQKCQSVVRRVAGHMGLILLIQVVAWAGWPASWTWAHRAADRLLVMAEGVEI